MDRNLDAFLAVARNENLTQASNQLGVTQPSVTKRIANLEAELGAALFVRHRRGTTLTTAGQIFYERAKRIELEHKQSKEEIAALNSAGLLVLRVGAGPVFHLSCVAGLFKTLKTRFPNLKLELVTEAYDGNSQMLMERKLDVYLGIIEPELLNDSIFVKYVTYVEHGIVMRRDDPHADLVRIDPSLLSHYHWIIFAVDPVVEQKIEDYCVPNSPTTPTVDVRTTSFATGLQLVKQGKFVMSAPLQLAPIVESEGLVIRPTSPRMARRRAGIHLRKSALGYAAIQTLLGFFDDVDFAFQFSKPSSVDHR